jgi:hypothetical protein
MTTTRRHTSRFLATAALVVAGLLASHPAFAAHAAAPSRAITATCYAFPEPLTFVDGKPVACRDARPADPDPVAAPRAAGHLSALQRAILAPCARPGYDAMSLCPLWH